MGLPSAVAMGAVAGVAVPWVIRRVDDTLQGPLSGDLVTLPVGGVVLPWSWLVFIVITVIAWGTFRVTRST